MNENLKKAINYTEQNKGNFNPRYRLGYHLMAPLGWINDPNGLIYYNGEYHAFYQHHPYDKDWGPMHWGHAVSKDMVHWNHLPIALAPGDKFDAGGCYSGSAVDDNGILTLIYTGHIFDDPTNRDPFSPDFHQEQNIARSADGINFEKYEGNPVIPAPPADNTQNFRDPKVWKENGEWNLIVGSSSKDGIGRTLIYRSKNLVEWNYIGVLASSNGELGSMWECPDFFELDGKYVQLFSPVGMEAKGDKYHNVFQTGSIIGEYDYEKNQFEHGEFVEMDRGHDFYAVQTLLAPDNRRIAFAWMNMWQTEMPEKEDNWAGAFTIPRELHVSSDNKLLMTPIQELKTLRIAKTIDQSYEIKGTKGKYPLVNNRSEIIMHFDAKQDNLNDVGFSLSDNKGVVATFKLEDNKLSFKRRGVDGLRCCAAGLLHELHLQVFVDKSSVEIFVNNGQETFTSRVYPASDMTVDLFSNEHTANVSIEAFSLKQVIK